jgi:hypothetical protein
MGLFLCFLTFQLAFSLPAEVQVPESLQLISSSESLKTRPIYTPTSNYLSKRDEYEEAKTKGSGLLCRLRSSDLSLESTYTWADLQRSGWTRQQVSRDDDNVITMFTNLEPVFHNLQIRQDDCKGVTWSNHETSKTAQGDDVEVCVHKMIPANNCLS